MAWYAVLALARVEFRRAWRTLVVLGLLAGLAGGVVIGATALARRTQTAPDRLRTAVEIDDARVIVFGDPELGRKIAALPMVESSWTATSIISQIKGDDVAFAGITAGPPTPPGLFKPVVVEGRAPERTNEIAIVEELAEQNNYKVGDRLQVGLLTPEQVAQFDTGFGEPEGPLLSLFVSGIVRMPSAGQGGVSGVLASESFSASYDAYSVGPTVLLRLRDEPGVEQKLSAALDRLSRETPLPADAEEFGPLQATFPKRSEDPKVRTAQRVLVSGLGVFVLVALLAGLIATAQSLSRHHAAGAGEQRIEAALGLTTIERVLARALPALLGAAVAMAVSATVALLTAGLPPMGGLHRFEPHPGWAPNVARIALGALGTGIAFVVVAAATTWRAARVDATASARMSVLPATLAARLRRPWLLAGTTVAVSRGRGRSAVPVRATAVGAVLGLAGVVAAATFSAGLHRLATTPSRYGWTADFSIPDAKPLDLPNVALDPRVDALNWVRQSSVRVGDRFVSAYSGTTIKGELGWTMLDGREPRTDDEVALGPAVADSIGAHVGDTATVTAPDGTARRLHVVGLVITPVDFNQALGESLLLTEQGLLALQQSPPVTSMLVKTRPGGADSLRHTLARRFEIISTAAPSEVRQVTDLGRLPDALALFLASVAAAALAHGLVLTSRRRAHDIAVLRALGFTPRQVGLSVITMSGVTAVIGLVLGIPLGLAIGRVVWHQVAESTRVAADVAVPLPMLLLIWPSVLLVAAALALLPARRSAGVQPAGVLRSE